MVAFLAFSSAEDLYPISALLFLLLVVILSGWWSGSKSGKSTPSPTDSPTESPTVSPTESPTLVRLRMKLIRLGNGLIEAHSFDLLFSSLFFSRRHTVASPPRKAARRVRGGLAKPLKLQAVTEFGKGNLLAGRGVARSIKWSRRWRLRHTCKYESTVMEACTEGCLAWCPRFVSSLIVSYCVDSFDLFRS